VRRAAFTSAERITICEMRFMGCTLRTIAEFVGGSVSAVWNVCDRRGVFVLPSPGAAKITGRRRIVEIRAHHGVQPKRDSAVAWPTRERLMGAR
jgi:hypothetical protein